MISWPRKINIYNIINVYYKTLVFVSPHPLFNLLMKTTLLILVSILAFSGPASFAQCDPTQEVVALVHKASSVFEGEVESDGTGYSGSTTSFTLSPLRRTGFIEYEHIRASSGSTLWERYNGNIFPTTFPPRIDTISFQVPGIRSSQSNTPYQGVHYRKWLVMDDNDWILVEGSLGEVKKFIEDPQKEILKFEQTFQGGSRSTSIRKVVAIWSKQDYSNKVDNRLPDSCVPKAPRVCYQRITSGAVTYLKVVDCDSCPSCDDLDDDDDCDKPIQINFQQPPSGQ